MTTIRDMIGCIYGLKQSLPAPGGQTGTSPNDGAALPLVTLTRGTETFTYNGANGRKGTLTVKGTVFVSMERMDGYVRLRDGEEYEAVLEYKGNPAEKVKAVFVNNTIRAGKPAGIFIHSARYPHHLEGCIAPGMDSDEKGLIDSSKAMAELFNLVAGGWKRWAKFRLKVEGDT